MKTKILFKKKIKLDAVQLVFLDGSLFGNGLLAPAYGPVTLIQS